MEVKVLGSGCVKCKKLEAATRKAIEELKVEADVEKVEKLDDIMSYGVISTPALVVDGEVLFTGRVPSIRELKKMLQK